MADPYDLLDEQEKKQMETELNRVRNRFLINKKKKMAGESDLIATQDENGQFLWGNAEEQMGAPGSSAFVDDGKDGFKEVSVEEAVTQKLPAFDYTQLKQDFGDVGSRAEGEIDPAVADKLNSVNIVDGEWYNIDDKGESWHLGEGESEAMELMGEGAKPGLGVMSARRIALQKLKNQEAPLDLSKEMPLPVLDKKRPSMLTTEENGEDEEMRRKMQARTAR